MIMLPCRPILDRSRLAVMMGGRNVVRVLLDRLISHRMAVTARRLHGNRSSQRTAAEQRQPDG